MHLSGEIVCQTQGRGLYDMTAQINQEIPADYAGVCHLFIQHTSASLIITENADPDVHTDLERFFSDLVIDGDSRFIHTAEGSDDMSAHIRSALTDTTMTLPVAQGRLNLGTWQGVYIWEHRIRPHSRKLIYNLTA